ncbi:HesB/IscA family protein [Microbacterium telephonicum]|uniref:Fe-S cluster assembly iron-binding protein IscA n=1 Tax=Microbacterium telephonicum TaxID=1714841 RepID=A0A498BTQ8_9MICO|nr:Fe-S cluster assembly protein HesB [Microbacterium telephonicum]RLK47363.1 Fe-S cluster assembly iron-binding protein IscA [Microbacterium telephonicum]
MLTLTENATTAVKNLTAQLPTDTGGLRISEAAEPGAGYAVSLAPAPEKGDVVVEEGGARVFVDPVATVQLDDRVLDARVDGDGSIGFALAQQS